MIIVIDDSPTICKICQVALGREGFEVVAFPDGVAAMQALVNKTVPLPELVMLDIDLPKMNGYEVARYLKSKPAFADIPVAMISRHCGVVDRLKARLAGARAFVEKPFTVQALVATVKEQLAKEHAHAAS